MDNTKRRRRHRGPTGGKTIALAIAIVALMAPAMLGADSHPVPENDLYLTYKGSVGPGAGKHIVLIAADQEYRSEQSLPMLASILAKRHGFDCTVLFSVNEKGEADPTKKIRWEDKTVLHNIPGLEHLAKADLMMLFSRLITLPIAWTKNWTGSTGKTARVFHVTMGSARDYQNAGLRRLTINAAYWCMNMEKKIVADDEFRNSDPNSRSEAPCSKLLFRS